MISINIIIHLAFLCTILRADMPPEYVEGTSCNRPCDGKPLNCYFNFIIETYLSMSDACGKCPDDVNDCFREECVVAGGVRRAITVVNRQMPGPAIEVCQGDRVRVDVRNVLETGEATSIHWHGQHVKKDPYMDGVPFVTQCPIHYNNNFTYDFEAATPGTHFYHSHVEVQRGDGLYGAFIVRQTPDNNYHNGLYQNDLSEHTLLVTDWNNQSRIEVYQKLLQSNIFLEPTGMLVNGLGFQTDQKITGTPMATFTVKHGQSYRFRMINTIFFDCPYELSVDGHQLIVIATDGQDVEPVAVDTIGSNSGERYDFIINATANIDTYWIRLKGKFLCERLGTFSLATLKYEGSEKDIPDGPLPNYGNASNSTGLLLNPNTALNPTQPIMTVDSLRSMKPLEDNITGEDVERFIVSLDMTVVKNRDKAGIPKIAVPQFNHISFKPFDFPLMPERSRVNESLFCNSETVSNMNCYENYCGCPHVLQVEKNKIVELVLTNAKTIPDLPIVHPIHLHGNYYRVISMVEHEEMINMDIDKLPLNLEDKPPLKDSAVVPSNGIVVIRFVADTPGYWLMHCHVDIHAMLGMMLVIKIGDDKDMPDPPAGFPQCYNFDYTT